MTAADYMLLAVVFVWIIAAARYLIRRRGRGGCCGSGCAGNCSSCPADLSCPSNKNKKTRKK